MKLPLDGKARTNKQRSTRQADMCEQIVLATDGSEAAARAVETAVSVAVHFDATVYPLFVVDSRRYGDPALSSTELVLEEVEQYGHEHLTDVAERASARGLDVVDAVRRGDPVDVIATYANETDADLVVVGAHRLGQPVSGGSVAAQLVDRTGRSVLAV